MKKTALCALLALGAAAFGQIPVVLPAPEGHAQATDVNASGIAVGSVSDISGLSRAIRWSGGTFKLLDGYQQSYMIAINATGVAAGQVMDDNHRVSAVTWDGQTVTVLPDLGHGGIAYDIADDGTVVGSVGTSEGTRKAAVWRNGELTTLEARNGDPATATGINASGVIVGLTFDSVLHKIVPNVWNNGVWSEVPRPDNLESTQLPRIADNGDVLSNVVLNGSSLQVYLGARWSQGKFHTLLPEPQAPQAQVFGVLPDGTGLGTFAGELAFVPARFRTGGLVDFLPLATFKQGIATAGAAGGYYVGTAYDEGLDDVPVLWSPDNLGIESTFNDAFGAAGQRISIDTLIRRRDGSPAPGVRVRVRIHADLIGYAVADRNGVARLNYRLPDNMTAGNRDLMFSIGGSDYVKKQLAVTQGVTTLRPTGSVGNRGGTARLGARIWNAHSGHAMAARPVEFWLNGKRMGGGNTNAQGLAVLSIRIPAAFPTGTHRYEVRFAGDASSRPARATAVLTVR